MPKREPVDIIVVTFSRRLYVEQTLQSIVENTKYPYRLIVIDNNSKDDTKKWLKENQGKLKIHKLLLRTKNIGVARARMLGLKHAKSKVVAFSDDDAWYNPGWLTECMRVLETYPEVAVVSADKPPGRDRAGKSISENRHGVPIIFRQCCRPYHMVCRRAAIIHVGGFRLPKNRVMGFMNSGLCIRLRRDGWRVARSKKQWLNPETGRKEWLVWHMDVIGGSRNHRKHYDDTGYTLYRSLAKRGKVNDFDPRIK